MDPITLALSLAQFAPSILRFFGVGEKSVDVAEKVVGIAQNITGKQKPEEVIAAMREDPQLAQQFNMAVLAADVELEKAYLADRKDARARDVQIRALNQGSNARADFMIAGCVVGILACLAVLTFYRENIPGEVVTLLTTVISIFGLCLRDAFQFEFGSSRGSKEKDELLRMR